METAQQHSGYSWFLSNLTFSLPVLQIFFLFQLLSRFFIHVLKFQNISFCVGKTQIWLLWTYSPNGLYDPCHFPLTYTSPLYPFPLTHPCQSAWSCRRCHWKPSTAASAVPSLTWPYCFSLLGPFLIPQPGATPGMPPALSVFASSHSPVKAQLRSHLLPEALRTASALRNCSSLWIVWSMYWLCHLLIPHIGCVLLNIHFVQFLWLHHHYRGQGRDHVSVQRAILHRATRQKHCVTVSTLLCSLGSGALPHMWPSLTI